MVSERTTKVLAYSVISGLGALLLILVFLFFYLLSYLVTGPGSSTLFIILICFLLHTIIDGLVFPGAVTLCKRSSELSINKKFASDLKTTINDLEGILISIQKPKENVETQQLKNYSLKFSRKNYVNVLRYLSELNLQSNIIPSQKYLHDKLLQLQENLKGIKVENGKNVENL